MKRIMITPRAFQRSQTTRRLAYRICRKAHVNWASVTLIEEIQPGRLLISFWRKRADGTIILNSRKDGVNPGRRIVEWSDAS